MKPSNPYNPPDSEDLSTGPQHPTYGRAIVVALVQQLFVLTFAALILDGGHLLRVVAEALILSWLVSLFAMIRWRDPSPLGISVVKYGFWLVLLILLGLQV